MFEYLIAREQDEMFRTSVRHLEFPDDKTRKIETYRLVWTWYDRAIAYEFGPTQDWLLDLVLKCAQEENISESQALGRVLDHIIKKDESDGHDYTDDHLELNIAMKTVSKWSEINSSK